MISNKNKLLLVAMGFVVLFIWLGVRAVQNNNALNAVVTVEVVPSGSNIIINGESASLGKNKVRAGEVQVVVEKGGFDSFTKTITVSENEDYFIGAALTPNIEDTKDWYEKHTEDQVKAEELSSQNFDQANSEALSNAPLIRELPTIGAGFVYRIDYGASALGGTPEKPAIFIEAPTPSARRDALTWIRSGGYDVSDYEIIFNPEGNE